MVEIFDREAPKHESERCYDLIWYQADGGYLSSENQR
jgi:hypothetical protein